MGFGEAIRVCFSKYADFNGRARRSEYWYFYLFSFFTGLIAGFLDGTILGGVRMLSLILNLGLLLPSLAVSVRRLHDTNRSGWLLLGWIGYVVVAVMVFLVVLGVTGGPYSASANRPTLGITAVVLVLGGLGYAIFLFVCMVLNGTTGENAYGPDPKGPDIEGVFS